MLLHLAMVAVLFLVLGKQETRFSVSFTVALMGLRHAGAGGWPAGPPLPSQGRFVAVRSEIKGSERKLPFRSRFCLRAPEKIEVVTRGP